MRIDRAEVLADLVSWAGFREGPNNENPFGPYQGIPNAAYCESFADGQPHRYAGYDHQVGLTESRCQFGPKGDAYTPWGVNHARERGEWRDDWASAGDPADLQPGDQVFFAWNNGAGPEPDHVETVTAVYADLTYDTVGANTGSPNGVWHPIRRDRKYLLGRRRPQLYYGPEPAPEPGKPSSPASFEPSGIATVHLVSAHSHLLLSSTGAHHGAQVVQREADGSLGQRWELWGHVDGTVSFRNRDGDLALDRPDYNTERGTQLQVARTEFNDAQRWQLDDSQRPGFTVLWVPGTNRMVDITGGSFDPGAVAQLWTPTEYDDSNVAPWQAFLLVRTR